MNIEQYVIPFLGVLFLLTGILLLAAQRSWIKSQNKALQKAYTTIEKLQDRLMSKNFDQYKMYDQPVKEYIPPEQKRRWMSSR